MSDYRETDRSPVGVGSKAIERERAGVVLRIVPSSGWIGRLASAGNVACNGGSCETRP